MNSGSRRTVLPVFLIVFAFAATSATARGGAPSGNLFTNGNFERVENGRPVGFSGWYGGAAVREDEGNHWVELSSRGSVTQDIPLEQDWHSLRISCRMRLTDVRRGEEGWQDARLVMNFRDTDGQHVDPWPNVIHGTGSTDWQEYEREYRIPDGAASLSIGPAMFGSSGTVEFDDVVVTVAYTESSIKNDLPPPEGAGEVWSLEDAWQQRLPTRARICLNGLWRFRPVTSEEEATAPPGENRAWGWFKVPGIWPRRRTGEAQELHLTPYFGGAELRNMDRAWQKRTFKLPASAEGRRVLLDLTLVQTHARAFVDGEEAGEVWFPGGRCDITDHVRPGAEHTLAILVTARPLKKTATAFMDPEEAREQDVSVDNKGLTGDVFLVTEPPADALGDVHVITSTRKDKISLDTRLKRCGEGERRLSALIFNPVGEVVKTLESDPFTKSDLTDGRITFSAAWDDPKLWDLHTPENVYDVIVMLKDADGRVLDQCLPVRFGFREFWIDGRNFLLNGKPVHLRALFVRNITRGADLASLAGCRRTCKALQDYGFNAFITSNYDFAPGSVGHMDALFRAADRTGVLCSFSLPHIKDFNGRLDQPEEVARYRKRCEYLIRRVQNHPSIVLYAMNHNWCGYHGDQDPLKIDGKFKPDPDAMGNWHRRNRKQAETARRIAEDIDPTRPAYHHQSGHLGRMHTVNCYLNWAPRQERSDWLHHWSSEGRKPLFFVEWGLPHISSWSSYRGPEFIWRTQAFQSVWDSEFAAPYVGPEAYRMTALKRRSLDWEEELWSRGDPFRWSRLIQHLRQQEKNHLEIKAHFADDNWRSHRTWGISAMLPWDQSGLWAAGQDYNGATRPNPNRWEDLKKPGIVPDNISNSEEYLYAREPETIEPTVLGRSFLRWNMPLCAYIGGQPTFTDKSHNVLPGEKIQKRIVILNDTRESVECEWSWRVSGMADATQSGKVPTISAGGRHFQPVEFRLPDAVEPGSYDLKMRVEFDNGEEQEDVFTIDVLPPQPECELESRVALFDPKGRTAQMLDELDIEYDRVGADAELSDDDLLVIGREAIGVKNDLPDVSAVRDGLKVLVCEQTPEALQNRLGFRINVRGLRKVFARTPDHPALSGLSEEHLAHWRGEATLVPPYLKEAGDARNDPKWEWCGFTNTRVWRCRNRACVASVLIEKPPRGNWLPVVDGGFDLQYAPLLECVEGQGGIVFCQLDITGRTDHDPAAERIFRNLLNYLDDAESATARRVYYSGDQRGRRLLKDLGVQAQTPGSRDLDDNDLLVIGPGSDAGPDAGMGANVLCLGLSQEELERIAPDGVKFETETAYSSVIEDFSSPAFRGLSNADIHWRTTLKLPLIQDTRSRSTPSLRAFSRSNGTLVLCQAAPWMFDTEEKPYLRTTYWRSVYMVSRLLANLGARPESGILKRFARKGREDATAENGPWLSSYYIQKPEAGDDPYRYYRW